MGVFNMCIGRKVLGLTIFSMGIGMFIILIVPSFGIFLAIGFVSLGFFLLFCD